MLKEVDVFEKGLLAIRNFLSVVPSFTIDTIEGVADKEEPDYRVSIFCLNLVSFFRKFLETLSFLKCFLLVMSSMSLRYRIRFCGGSLFITALFHWTMLAFLNIKEICEHGVFSGWFL